MQRLWTRVHRPKSKNMIYNWQSAATPQGRERLKELLDGGYKIVGKVGEFGRITAFWRRDHICYDIDGFIPVDMFPKMRLEGIEFLDPEPPMPQPDQRCCINCLQWFGESGNPEPLLCPKCKHELFPVTSSRPQLDENGLFLCPFCGGKAEIHYQLHDLEDYAVKCSNCGCEPCPWGLRVSKAEAIEDWNSRQGKEAGV